MKNMLRHLKQKADLLKALEHLILNEQPNFLVGVCDTRNKEFPYYFLLEIDNNELYRLRRGERSDKFIQKFIERGNLVEGRINLMKYKGRFVDV